MLLFFDIDGVLNRESDWKRPFTLNPGCVEAFCDMVRQLANKEEVQLVSVSTWRRGTSDDIVAEAFARYGLAVSGKTPVSDKGRQAEVEYYLRRHPNNRYLIIDDDLSLYADYGRLNIYTPDYRTGFTKKDIKKAVRQAMRGV